MSPLFSTFRLTADAGNKRVGAGVVDPGLNTFASSLRDRLSITMVHLPLVPSALDDEDAWSAATTLPEHRAALASVELRQWLHYLAHTTLKAGAVNMPEELRAHAIFRRSADKANDLLRTSAPSVLFSEKDVADAQEEGREEGREEALAEAAARESALRAEFEARESEFAARESAMRAELERLKGSGSGSQ